VIQLISKEEKQTPVRTETAPSNRLVNSRSRTDINVETKQQSSNLIGNHPTENMEHDIRTPLSSIWGLVDLLHQRETDPYKKTLLTDVATCIQELNDYCNHIIEFFRIEADPVPVRLERVVLKNIIDEIIQSEQNSLTAKKLRLACYYEEFLPETLIGDGYRLRCILSQLINNAVKFTHQGTIFIKILLEKFLNQHVILLRIEVQDTGIGIPLDKQEAIYKKFVRLTSSNQGLYKGLGVGLYIVKKLLKEIGGTITMTSAINQGSRFICLVPLKNSRNYNEASNIGSRMEYPDCRR